jgi:TRAP-type C4-dicarboxylate transport system substrate-binding protein
LARHRHKSYVLWTSVLLAALTLILGRFPASAQSITLRLSTQSLPTSTSIKSITHFKERVETKSHGRLRVEIYDSGKLYSDSAVGAAVSTGAVEMAYLNLARYGSKSLVIDAFELPFLFNTSDIEKAARAPGSEVRHVLDAVILAEMNARVLWWVSEGKVIFFANGMAVSNIDHVAGKNVRVVSPLMENAVRLCGGNPIYIGVNDQIKAYQERRVDIGMSSIATVLEREIYKYMDTITVTNHASAEFVVAINEQVWQALPKDLKDIISEAASLADSEASEIIAGVEAGAYKQLVDRYGVKVVGLTHDELSQWRICTSDVLTDFMDKTASAGQALMRAYGRLRERSCCSQPDR